MGPIRCPETSVNNYRTTPRNIPEERRSRNERLSHGVARPTTLVPGMSVRAAGQFPTGWED
jgi:hypothetical protein